MATAGNVVTTADGVHTLEYDENFQNALMFYFVMIVWIVEWMGAVAFMIITGAILIVFFDNDPNQKEKRWPLWESVKLVLWNHLGTAAIGSFLITVLVIIKWIVYYLMEQAKQQDQTGFMKYIAECVKCCCECIEQCMRYMTNLAYI